jgi:hypothetical protein
LFRNSQVKKKKKTDTERTHKPSKARSHKENINEQTKERTREGQEKERKEEQIVQFRFCEASKEGETRKEPKQKQR